MNYWAIAGMKKDTSIYISVEVVNIITVVTEHFETTLAKIANRRRYREIVIPRQMCYYFLRKETNLTYKAIGSIFGGFDHTSVIHGIQTIKDLWPRYPKIAQDILEIDNKLSK